MDLDQRGTGAVQRTLHCRHQMIGKTDRALGIEALRLESVSSAKSDPASSIGTSIMPLSAPLATPRSRSVNSST